MKNFGIKFHINGCIGGQDWCDWAVLLSSGVWDHVSFLSVWLLRPRPCIHNILQGQKGWGVSKGLTLLNGPRKSVSHSLPENQGGDPVIATKKTFVEHRNTEADWGIHDLERSSGWSSHFTSLGVRSNYKHTQIEKVSQKITHHNIPMSNKNYPKTFSPSNKFLQPLQGQKYVCVSKQKRGFLRPLQGTPIRTPPSIPQGEGKMISVLQDALHKPENGRIIESDVWGFEVGRFGRPIITIHQETTVDGSEILLTRLRLIVYPIMYRVFTNPRWFSRRMSEPSTNFSGRYVTQLITFRWGWLMHGVLRSLTMSPGPWSKQKLPSIGQLKALTFSCNLVQETQQIKACTPVKLKMDTQNYHIFKGDTLLDPVPKIHQCPGGRSFTWGDHSTLQKSKVLQFLFIGLSPTESQHACMFWYCTSIQTRANKF